MFNKKWHVLIAVLVIGSTLLAACAQPQVETIVEQVEVTRVVEIEGETVIEIEEVEGP